MAEIATPNAPPPGLARHASSERVRKDEPLYILIVTVWVSLLLYFNPRLLALVTAAPDAVAAVAVVAFVLCLNSFWLFAVYDTVMIAASFIRRRTPEPVFAAPSSCPPVAILYPTRNDFREVSAESCLAVDYPDFHLFLLDDSTDGVIRQRVDVWASARAGRVTVIRRENHGGFKAGNLNHALKRVASEYPLFAVCDADGLLPKDFISALLPYFENDPDVAFVQALQKANPAQQESFGRMLAWRIAAHYRHYVRAKDRFGFVMFYGHGALLRTAAWKAAGGFPEIVTEDLAFAARVRAFGWHGVYTEKTACYEDFPPTWGRYRARSEKWIRGTSEFMRTGYPSFFRSKNVPWFEKFDVFVGAFSHWQPAVMLSFLLMLGTLLPLHYAYFRYPGSFFLEPVPHGKSLLDYVVHVRYHIFWAFDFYAVMLITFLAPVIPAAIEMRREPRKLVEYLAGSNFIFLGSLVAESLAAAAFLLTGKAVFRNTHAVFPDERGYHPNHGVVFALEIAVAALLAYLGFKTRNLWFFAPASALFLSPIVHWAGWENRFVRAAVYVPFSVGLVILFFVSMDLVVTKIGL